MVVVEKGSLNTESASLIHSNFEKTNSVYYNNVADDFDHHGKHTIDDDPTYSSMEEEHVNTNCWSKTKKVFNWFGQSQLLAHILLFTTLITFGGYVVLIPHSIAIMHPTTFALFRSLLIVIGLFPVTVIKDSAFSFRSEKVLERKLSKFGGIGILKRIYRYILRKTPNWRQAKQIFVLGLFINLNQILFFMGLRWTNSTIAGIMQPLVAIITCIMSVILKREGRSILKFFGVFLAVGGAVAMLVVSTLFNPKKKDVIDDADSSTASAIDNFINTFSFTIGMLFLCVNMFFYALYLINFKKTFEKEKIPVLTLALWTWTIGSLVPLLPSVYFLTADYGYSPIQIVLRMDVMAYAGILYGGLVHGTLFFVLNSKASSLTTPTIIGVYSTLNPIVTSLMAFFILGERVTPLVVPGAALILIGVAVVITAKWREGKQKDAQSKTRREYLSSCWDFISGLCGRSWSGSEYDLVEVTV
ncbi:DUF6 domain-containing protein [Naegleria gruberi]|uniref:DUF6 domain-containing protein n=1 Tax=Naegleria gruberi TaxID=5762 RepID=D2V4L7_NAEGR|nr:DUF6 domain-containing protein [Naegleria gruberi]EFC48122.1 DUF6 domain-containing protein [Naegleria gruberi]|eukprot:XP_002680866.1 DUF6 domain-containing protein [Naegleria gruberi strain NEG-M]